MLRRLLAVWRDRGLVVAGQPRYPGFLWRHLLAALREPKEPPRTAGEHQCTRACDLKYGVDYFDNGCPDADPDPATVHLSPLSGVDDPGPATVVPHEGATEDWSPAADFADSQPTGGAGVPETRAMRLEADRLLHEALSDVEARLRAGLDRWWAGWLARIGVDEAEVPGVETFDDAMTLAGVIALPAVAVDYSTGEYEAVPA